MSQTEQLALFPDPVLTSDNTLLSEPKRKPRIQALAAFTPRADQVSPSVRQYLQVSTADNTRRAYRFDLRHFVEWGGTVPATPETVAEYLAAHAGELATSTLERRLATIAKAHATQGLQNPTQNELVRMTMRGIKRTHGKPQLQAAPATKEIVKAMVVGLGDSLKDTRDRALILVGFAGAFRRSELCEIDFTDMERADGGIRVTLPRSKTDQEGRGQSVFLPCESLECCPVRALNAWLEITCIESGPIFRSVDRHGNISRKSLSPEAVNKIIKIRVAVAGLNPDRYSGHSLRAGYATSAAADGSTERQIMKQTRHSSSTTVGRYIRPDLKSEIGETACPPCQIGGVSGS